MQRQLKNAKMGIPTSVLTLVRAQCLDYERRTRIISNPNAEETVKEKYIALNRIIDEALSVVDCGIRMSLFRDIQLGRGYAHSPASPFLAKNTYYSRKRALIRDIAIGFSLL